MAKTVLFAAALLLLGALAGNSIARYVQQQHRHARSVMTLAQFHFDRLSSAAQTGQCPSFNLERDRLRRVYEELLEAFPLSVAQDPEFRKRAEAMRAALGEPSDGAGSCSNARAEAKSIDDACDDCHREYR